MVRIDEERGVSEVRESSLTPIAVVGMACRLPGGIDSPHKLWEALLRGDDMVTEVPADRWDADDLYDPESGVQGRSVSKWGAFIDDVAGFDPDDAYARHLPDRTSSVSTSARPSRWIRSIACCWKPAGKP